MHRRPLAASLLLCLLIATCAAGSKDEAAQRSRRRPTQFAIIYNMGYAGDYLPGNPEHFQNLILACQEAHYNVVLCKYTGSTAGVPSGSTWTEAAAVSASLSPRPPEN